MIGKRLQFLRKATRTLIFRRTSDPDLARSTTARKKFTGSYSEFINMPSFGTGDLQDPSTGLLVPIADYDASI